MPILSILIFFAAFSSFVLLGLYIYLSFYNKRSQLLVDNFMKQNTDVKLLFFQDIKISYSETSGLKTYIFPNNYCDLYLFDNYLAIVRKQHFIFKVLFAPMVLSSNTHNTNSIFNHLKSYKPSQIIFKELIKGEIDIKLNDINNKHYTIDITLKGLTNEQLTQLDIIKKWC